jgi:TorA maturation chaperone TorD
MNYPVFVAQLDDEELAKLASAIVAEQIKREEAEQRQNDAEAARIWTQKDQQPCPPATIRFHKS